MFASLTSFRKKHLALTLAALGAMLLWIFAWVFVGLLSGDDATTLQSVLMPLGPLAKPLSATASVLSLYYGLVQVCLLAPVCEELVFRLGFCSIAYDEHGKARGNWSKPLVLVGCAFLFGAAHGFRYGFSYEMVIRMGMLGGILGLLYVMLKKRGASAIVALSCCIFAHGAYNFSVTGMQMVAEKAAVTGYKRGVDDTTEACKQVLEKLIPMLPKGTVPDASAAPAPAPSTK